MIWADWIHKYPCDAYITGLTTYVEPTCNLPNIINSNIITSDKGEYTNEAVGLPKSIYYVINGLCSKKLVLQYTSGVHTFRTSSLAHNNCWSCAFFKGLFLFVTCLSLECSFGFVANNDVKMTVNIRKICSLRSQCLSLNKWAANSRASDHSHHANVCKIWWLSLDVSPLT